MKYKDISGEKFGKLTVICRQGSDNTGKNAKWLCKCDCGEETMVSTFSLKKGDSTSCGCKRSPKPEIRIKSKIKIDGNGCWNWTEKLNHDGYAKIYYIDRYLPAHRASYEIFVCKVPRDKIVCHKCDNRKCINPDHLYIGTHKENRKDALDRNRVTFLTGEKHQNSKYSDIQRQDMRNKYISGIPVRQICQEYNALYSTILYIVKKGKHK